jgi:hypothetical protein
MPHAFTFRRSLREASTPAPAAHIEIWDHFVAVNRMLKRMVVVSSATALLAVGFAAWLGLVALERPVVYYVAPDGAAAFGGRLGDADAPLEVEVRYLAKRFVRHAVAANSLTIEADLAEAWNLMTDELRAEHTAELAAYERERGYSFVEHIQRQQIRTAIDIDRVDITNHNDRAFAVRLTGRVRTWPLNRVGEEAGFEERDLEAQLTLVRVPRTESTPNGLLVAQQATRFFAPTGEAEALEETVPVSGAAP